MKQFDKKIEEYKELVWQYHKALDLMSNKGLANLNEKIEDVYRYSSQIKALKLKNKRLLDIGTGAGLPGIVLAILLPEWQHSLVERRQRRASFLTIVKSKLLLKNVEIYNADVKELCLDSHSVITAQAVASFYSLYCLSTQLHAENTALISRKGDDWQKEIAEIQAKIDSQAKVFAPKKLSNGGNLVTISLVGGKKCRQSV